MTPPAGSTPRPADRGAGARRPRAGYGRALRVGFAISALVHLIALLIYPSLQRLPAGGPVPLLPPIGGEPAQGMTVLRIVTVDATSESERPPEPEQITPVEQPAEAPAAPDVEERPGTGLVPPGPTVVERLRPFLANPRLWVELDPDLNELTLGQILELELAGRITEWQDSLESAIAAERALTDWTYTDGEGKRWGISEGKIYLGDLALPLPFAFGTPVGKRDEVNRRAWEWEEIQRGAASGAIRGSWKERAEAIRARRDRERARARPDTSGIRF
jgi:hypothetical protein